MRNKWYAPGSLHQIVFDFLRLHCQSRDDLINFGRRLKEKYPTNQLDPNMLGAGLVTKQQLLNLFLESCGGHGVGFGNPLARIYDALVYWDAFTEFPVSNSRYDFQINFIVVQQLESKGVLENIVKGPGILPWRYYPATAAILVEKEGRELLGSGAVVSHNGRVFLLTNRHVVDPADKMRIKSIWLGDAQINLGDVKLVLSDTDDLAGLWPAPGSEDTELGVLMELEVGHGETK
ncbi:MAG: serine protease, partial [Xanthobacteraceae bacterium]|nr:serine protease [Xanthobacteraceae bacterium]